MHKNQKDTVYKISKHRINIYVTVFKLLMQKIIEWLFGLKYVHEGRKTLFSTDDEKTNKLLTITYKESI